MRRCRSPGFCQITGIPRRTCHRKLARYRSGEPVLKCPWPAPAVDAVEPLAAKYAADWPAWGHRKIHAMMAAGGHAASVPAAGAGDAPPRPAPARRLRGPAPRTRQGTQGCLRRPPGPPEPGAAAGLLRVRDHRRRHLAAGRRHRLLQQVRAPACTGADAIAAIELAIAEAGRLGGAPLARLLPGHPDTSDPVRIRLVTGNGPAFKGAAFARFIASRTGIPHIRTRARSPGHSGVRERTSGSLKYEHLYRHADQIATLAGLHREAEAYRQVFNHTRPHEALAMRRPAEIIRDPSLHPVHKNQTEDLVPEA